MSASRRLRLAVYGLVDEAGGSGPSGHHHLLRAMLDRGHSIDLYGQPAHVGDPGFSSPAFRYVALDAGEPAWIGRPLGSLTGFPARMAQVLRGAAFVVRAKRSLRALMTAADASERYDAVVCFGVPPWATLDGRPVVVWPQSGPGLELKAFRERFATFVAISGLLPVLTARIYYELRDRLGWRWLLGCWLISGSAPSLEAAIARGADRARTIAIPYPLDLGRFNTPNDHAVTGRTGRVLCVGRLDPRKRVDLAIDAAKICRAKGIAIELVIVGRAGYLPGWDRVVQEAVDGALISYSPHQPQSEIIDMMHHADLLLQTSENEEYGSAVAEALATGTPVALGPTNGTAMWASPASAVVYCEISPVAVAEAIREGLSLSARPATASACRQAAEQFRPERIAETFEGFLVKAVDG